jgi:hypothetical protein
MLGNVSFTLNRAHSIPPSIPQRPYNLFSIPCPNFDPTHQVVVHNSKKFQEESFPNKRMIIENKKEHQTKGKEVKPHLLIQGHEKLHEKREKERR